MKITDYGLHRVAQSQVDPSVMSALRKNSMMDGKDLLSNDVQILTSSDKLLWVAPETIACSAIGFYFTSPTKKGDIYRYEANKFEIDSAM